MTKQFEYDAFISYRHTELDKYAAELLHRQMEAFRLPGNLAKQRGDGRTRITRVFRDKDELPLTNNLEDPIMQALASSEFLIVICSPRIRESLWCRKEIETFISMHGREKILAVLVEGEPGESFPEELLYREETVTDADGTTHTERIPMEPLAADIRGKDKKAMKKALKMEILRLLAPMFSLNYDDLRQRHRERRMKRILTASLSVGAVFFAFGLVSTAMALRIQSQKAQIEAQSAEILKQNQAIQQQNQEITEQNQLLLQHQAVGLAEEAKRLLDAGDRESAVQTAYSALTSFDGNLLPYTTEAQFVLTESLGVYDNGYSMKPMIQMETAGIIYYMKLTQDRKTLVTYDYSKCLTIWDVASGSKIGEIRDLYDFVVEDTFAMIGNDRILYINNDSKVVVYDISTGQTVREADYKSYGSVYTDAEGKHLVFNSLSGIKIVDGETFEETESYNDPDYTIKHIHVNSDGTYLAFQEEDAERDSRLQIWDLETGEKYPAVNVGTRFLQEICYRDGIAYALLNDNTYDYTKIATTVLAFEIKTGHVLWEYTADTFGNKMLLPYAEGATRMLMIGSSEGFLLELDDGSEAGVLPYGTSIAGATVFVNANNYGVFTRGGEYHIVMADIPEDYYIVGRLISHSQNVKDFMVAEGGFLILPYQDNKVTYYMFSQGQDLTLYEGEVQVPEAESYSSTDARSLTEEMGLPKAALASYVFYDQEKSKLFVSCTDDTLDIYSTADMSLINTLSVVGAQKQYFGTDNEGNIYIGGYGYGYMLNAECKPLAVIEALSGVDAENGKLFIDSDSDGMCTVPIYSVEELLAKAKADVL